MLPKEGWIKLHRKIQDCFIWSDKPYDKARAWIDLLLLAMHRDKKLLVDGSVVVIERGSFFTSRIKLSKRWGWSLKKVDAFLKLLEQEEMVTTVRTPKGTTLTIVNYEQYQLFGTTEDTTREIPQDTPKGTAEDTQKKNIKNDKKNNIGEKSPQKRFVQPTVEEVEAYCQERGNNINAQTFIDFYESKGWMVGKNKMKNWKAAVRTWEGNDRKNGRVSNQSAQQNPTTADKYRAEFDALPNVEFEGFN